MRLSSETTGKNKKKDPERFTCEVSEKQRKLASGGLGIPSLPLRALRSQKNFPDQHLQVTHPLIYQTAACRDSPPTHLERNLQGFLSLPSRDLLLAATGRSLQVWKMGVLLTAKKKKGQKNKNNNKLTLDTKR